MIKKLSNEFLKLKYSRMGYFIVGGAAFTPMALLMLVIILNNDNKYDSVTFLEYMAMVLKFFLSIVGITVYNCIAAEIMAREFRMDTVKSQLTIPISRSSFVFIKLLTISIILLGMTIISFFLGVVLSIGLEIKGFTLGVAYELFWVYLKAGVLMLPFAYFTVYLVLIFRQTLMPMVINVIILIGTSVLGNTEIFAVFPWTAPFRIIFISSAGIDLNHSIGRSYFVIYLLGILSMYFSHRHINRMEI